MSFTVVDTATYSMVLQKLRVIANAKTLISLGESNNVTAVHEVLNRVAPESQSGRDWLAFSAGISAGTVEMAQEVLKDLGEDPTLREGDLA